MKRYTTILLTILVTVTILVSGCTKEWLTDDLPIGHNNVTLSLTARSGENTTVLGNEAIVNTLRLMIFNSDDVQIKNSYYEGVKLDELKNSSGVFSIIERLPRDLGQIKVCLVANEPLTWDLGRIDNKNSYNVLKNLMIRYDRDFDFINNNGNSDDLNLYISPNDYFLMCAETSVNFTAGDVALAEVLLLKRTAAKVTLTLGYDQLSDVNYVNGEDFVLKSVSIQNQPIYSYFFARTYDNDEFFSTVYQTFTYNPDTQITQPLVFYIPEYYLSAKAMDTGLFTYIEVLGEYSTGGMKVPVVYKIPLGEGVQKMYTDNSYIPVISDYSIMRNHHYVVNGRITKLGEKEGIQAKISISPWLDGGDVDVEDAAPYLNVSNVVLEHTVYPGISDISDKLFFWSNQPQGLITVGPVTALYYDSSGSEMDISGLTAESLPSVNVHMTKYSISENSDNFFKNNGDVAIDIKLPSTITWSKLIVTFYVQAGNLKRRITITYNTGTISG